MSIARTMARRLFVAIGVFGVLGVYTLGLGTMVVSQAIAQESGPQPIDAAGGGVAADDATVGDRDARAAAGLAAAEADLVAQEPSKEVVASPDSSDAERINVLELLVQGGPMMLPIALMSLVVVTFGIERIFGLRRHRVLPPELIAGLGTLASRQGGFDPRKAYKLCQRCPSSSANVIKAMLLKVGRPHPELERAVSEASQREATKLYANVRWLSLAAAVSPLLGLLGTVGGMILAFHNTANLPTGVDKAEVLAEGIYMALVTTFAGLVVAIPAAVLAHGFEGRIQKVFCELDEILLGLMPQLERFEGRLRVSQKQLAGNGTGGHAADGPTNSGRDTSASDDYLADPAATPK